MLLGMIRFIQGEIVINSDMPEDIQYVTLWHESLHAIESQMGAELGEKVVEGLAFHIVDFLADNGVPTSEWAS